MPPILPWLADKGFDKPPRLMCRGLYVAACAWTRLTSPQCVGNTLGDLLEPREKYNIESGSPAGLAEVGSWPGLPASSPTAETRVPWMQTLPQPTWATAITEFVQHFTMRTHLARLLTSGQIVCQLTRLPTRKEFMSLSQGNVMLFPWL